MAVPPEDLFAGTPLVPPGGKTPLSAGAPRTPQAGQRTAQAGPHDTVFRAQVLLPCLLARAACAACDLRQKSPTVCRLLSLVCQQAPPPRRCRASPTCASRRRACPAAAWTTCCPMWGGWTRAARAARYRHMALTWQMLEATLWDTTRLLCR